MNHRAHLAAIVAVAAGFAGPAVASATVGMTVAPSKANVELGQEFTVRSTIRSDGPTEVSGLVAHLTVLSLDDGTYIDPEDWSSDRTRRLRPIPGGGATTILWRLKAVTSGAAAVGIVLYSGSDIAKAPVAPPAVHVVVTKHTTLDSGGMLPLAIGFPAALALVALTVRRRRRPGPASLAIGRREPE